MVRDLAGSRQTQREFLANISHDLKTPLTAIQGFAQAITEGAVSGAEKVQHAADVIRQEADRMQMMVEQLLEIARVEGPQVNLDIEPVNVAAMIDEIVASFCEKARQQGCRLVVDAPEVPLILADPMRLPRAIENLIDNALKYGDPDSDVYITASACGRDSMPTPTVSWGPNPRPSGWVWISVINHGPQIAETELMRIFERLYRADKSRATPGSGLGLAIARETLLAHGGGIGVESTQEETRFTIWIHAARGD